MYSFKHREREGVAITPLFQTRTHRGSSLEGRAKEGAENAET